MSESKPSCAKATAGKPGTATRRFGPMLCINECPIHREFLSISIDSEHGGRRITPSKCCGQWRTVKSWRLSGFLWADLILEARKALRIVKREEARHAKR